MSGGSRQNGRRVLLGDIRRHGPLPRIELAQRTGLSRATVTTITAELLAKGLIEELQQLEEDHGSRRGRPRVGLRLNPGAHLIAGTKLSRQTASLVLLGFDGGQLATLERPLPAPVMSPELLASFLRSALTDLAAEAGARFDDLSGIGLGIPGLVAAPQGFVHWSPSLEARNVDLGRSLSAALGRPVLVDNDANLVAVAEKNFGLGQNHSDFMVITIESGVGMGIVLGDRLYRGTRGCGAEFGHTKVQLDGALCRCGQRGCLEAYVADYALLREAALLQATDGSATNTRQIETLLGAARRGDTMARSIVERAGRFFAMGLANLVNIFDPELIILAGEQMQFDHLYDDTVLESMRRWTVQVDRPPPQVVAHKWGNLMWARGAAAYALDHVTQVTLDEMDHDPE